MRLIDADYVMSALGIFNDREHGNEHFLNGIETAKEIVEEAPTIGGGNEKGGEVEMNLINYNQAIEALDKERQLLLNREQYGAEHVLVHHAINVIAELPIIRPPEIVRCRDCKNQDPERLNDGSGCFVCRKGHGWKPDEWFCADGERR